MKHHVRLRLEWHALLRALVELERVSQALPRLGFTSIQLTRLNETLVWLRDFATGIESKIQVALDSEAE